MIRQKDLMEKNWILEMYWPFQIPALPFISFVT